jgi:phenylacetate-CoA ligase
VRYNIHDLGQVIRIPVLKKAMQACGVPLKELGTMRSDLPLLLHYGRADAAVAFYGCKITPMDIQEVFVSIPDLAKHVHSFSLITFEDEKLDKKLEIAFELNEGVEPFAKEKEELRQQVLEALKKVNQDFREASQMIPKGSEPTIAFHKFLTGPFAVNDVRLKQHYVQKQ